MTFEQYWDACPPEVLDVLRSRLQAEHDGGEDCIDNERWAYADYPESVATYENLREGGCCGFHDEEVEVDGVRFLLGYNYGH